MHREADRYLNGEKCVRESVPGPTETAGRQHSLRCSQRMGMGHPGRRDCMGTAEANTWGEWIWHREPHATQGTYHSGALVTASPALAPFCGPIHP